MGSLSTSCTYKELCCVVFKNMSKSLKKELLIFIYVLMVKMFHLMYNLYGIIIIIIISAMWKQKAAQVIPIVISSTGIIPKSLSQSLIRLNLQPNTYIQLQKSVILATCSIVRNFLNYK